jgi:ATP-dependent RNA helicase DHX37/DHR1
VDAGRSKQKLLEAHSGAAVARYSVDWVSKAAAEQRAGRAGRTGPGHVYRLFSSAHFNNNFKQHSDPEIANTPLEGVVLLLKAMGVDKVRYVFVLQRCLTLDACVAQWF